VTTPPDLPPDLAADEDGQVGENTCPDCAGTGSRDGGNCPACAGTGTVAEVVGDA
jgi:DnaJ-class molecular chaperone